MDEWTYPNDAVPSAQFPIYSRGNVGEAFPNVISPLSGSLMLDASARSQRRFFLAIGGLSKRQVRDARNQMFAQFGGYLYTNVSMARLAAVRAPGMSLDDLDAQYGGVAVLPAYKPQRGDRSIRGTLRLAIYASRALRLADADRARLAQQEVDDWVASLTPLDEATDAELLARARRASSWFDRLNAEMMTVTLHAGVTRVLIERFSSAVAEPQEANAITSGVGDVASAGPAIALWDLGRDARDSEAVAGHFDAGDDGLEARLREDPACQSFVESFDRFLDLFGFHGVDELELSAPKWGTDHHDALRMIERLRRAPNERDPRATARALAAERVAATNRVAAKLNGPRRRLFHLAARNAAIYAREREATKAALVRALFESRRALNELGRRHGICDDIYFLLEAELEPALDDPGTFADTIHRRRRLRQALQDREPPFWFEGVIPHPSTWPLRSAAAPITNASDNAVPLQGLGVSAGVVTGTTRVIHDPTDAAALAADEILVAPQTDPAWTPLFLAAAGVVVEYGAVMSHAAIVARELGIPTVVGIDRATIELRTGTPVTLDGTTGTVTIHS